MVPRCLVFIPDGNRRWAKMHHHRPSWGHIKGLVNTRTISRAAFNQGVEHVIFWAASEANLRNRPREETAHLFKLLKRELRRRLEKSEEEIAFHLCGGWDKILPDPELAELIRAVEEKTAQYQQHMTVLFGYSGRSDLLAAQKALRQSDEDITEESFCKHLWTAHIPDVDLLIRTGMEGDPHLSDLLLPWQMHNTQLQFSKAYWPEFTTKHLLQEFADFAARQRRCGA